MKLIPSHNYITSPWKNGMGITTQMAIFPQDASLKELNFNWRISSASIKSENEFSQFLGFKRILTVVKGNGLILNQHTLKQFEVFHFDGSEKINCNLLDGPVEDLGIIYNPNKVNAEMKIISKTKLELNSGYHFLFTDNQCFEINSPETIEIKNLSILISIYNI